MMGIFKRWFSKRDNESFPDFNAYILFSVDSDGEASLTFGAEEGSENDLSELVCMFNSGVLLQQSLMLLKNEFSEELAIETANKLSHFINSQQQEVIDRPVVSPLNVFKQGERNDFKG